MHRRARLFETLDNGSVRCLVCERRCIIPIGGKGVCGNYVNADGELVHVGYAKISAVESRPIEIKPLFHYWPNSTALTFSGWGCNFYCPWCQNHFLSFRHPQPNDPEVLPEELVERALRNGDHGLCASFNEPTTLFDYLIDVFELGKKRGLYGTIVTNGYLTPRAIEMLVEVGVDGWSIDIKGCPGTKVLSYVDHEKVFRNAKLIKDLGGHVEMVYLVVTGANDHEECYRWIIEKHLDYLGPETPLHINRYYPMHLWNKPPTPIYKLLKIAEYAKKMGIEYVYIGNVHDPELETTRCPKCSKVLIYRRWYRVEAVNLDYSNERYRCPRCGKEIPIKGKIIVC